MTDAHNGEGAIGAEAAADRAAVVTGTTGGHDVATGVRSMMRQARIPGLSIVVVDRDGVRYAAGFGSADLERGVPVTPGTRHPWFSMTKIATATAALRLADEGRLGLDEPVASYLDSTPLASFSGRLAAISTRQLLSHTAGLANPLPVRWIHRAEDPRPDSTAMTGALLARRGMFRSPPGSTAAYSNVGYLLAGEVISAVTGRSVEESLTELVIRPLGMTETAFSPPRDGAAVGYLNLPWPLQPTMSAILPASVRGARASRARPSGVQSSRVRPLRPFALDGAAYGGLVGSVLDVGRLLRLHLRDGEWDGAPVLARQTAQDMRVIVGRGRSFEHATGWFRQPRPGRRDYVEHFGTGVGFWNVARLYPEVGIGVAIMTNGTRSYPFHALMNGIADSVGRG
jgi:CubicO group peptidase (beta-lactamase class C family)